MGWPRHERRGAPLFTKGDDGALANPLDACCRRRRGAQPDRAVGLLLCHLNHICHHTTPDRPQVWKLSVSQKDYDEPRKYLEKIAEKRHKTVEELVQIHKLPARELRRASR